MPHKSYLWFPKFFDSLLCTLSLLLRTPKLHLSYIYSPICVEMHLSEFFPYLFILYLYCSVN